MWFLESGYAASHPPEPPITPRQKAAALTVAGVVDLIQIVLFPVFGLSGPFEVVLDILAAVILVAICGFKWQFVVAFTLELFPVVLAFPTWSAFVLTLPSAETPAPQGFEVRATVPPVQKDDGGRVVDAEGVIVPPVQPTQLPHGRP